MSCKDSIVKALNQSEQKDGGGYGSGSRDDFDDLRSGKESLSFSLMAGNSRGKTKTSGDSTPGTGQIGSPRCRGTLAATPEKKRSKPVLEMKQSERMKPLPPLCKPSVNVDPFSDISAKTKQFLGRKEQPKDAFGVDLLLSQQQALNRSPRSQKRKKQPSSCSTPAAFYSSRSPSSRPRDSSYANSSSVFKHAPKQRRAQQDSILDDDVPSSLGGKRDNMPPSTLGRKPLSTVNSRRSSLRKGRPKMEDHAAESLVCVISSDEDNAELSSMECPRSSNEQSPKKRLMTAKSNPPKQKCINNSAAESLGLQCHQVYVGCFGGNTVGNVDLIPDDYRLCIRLAGRAGADELSVMVPLNMIKSWEVCLDDEMVYAARLHATPRLGNQLVFRHQNAFSKMQFNPDKGEEHLSFVTLVFTSRPSDETLEKVKEIAEKEHAYLADQVWSEGWKSDDALKFLDSLETRSLEVQEENKRKTKDDLWNRPATRPSTRMQTESLLYHTRSQSAKAGPIKSEPAKRILHYPKGSLTGVTLSSADLPCLCDGEFLNDNIIDFYLLYLMNDYEKCGVPKTMVDRTYVFSSFFYRSLTLKPKNADGPYQSSEEAMHARVKKWTRGVNIFEKDFVIIPINESSHWFLAIICFPGSDGPVPNEDQPTCTNVLSQEIECTDSSSLEEELQHKSELPQESKLPGERFVEANSREDAVILLSEDTVCAKSSFTEGSAGGFTGRTNDDTEDCFADENVLCVDDEAEDRGEITLSAPLFSDSEDTPVPLSDARKASVAKASMDVDCSIPDTVNGFNREFSRTALPCVDGKCRGSKRTYNPLSVEETPDDLEKDFGLAGKEEQGQHWVNEKNPEDCEVNTFEAKTLKKEDMEDKEQLPRLSDVNGTDDCQDIFAKPLCRKRKRRSTSDGADSADDDLENVRGQAAAAARGQKTKCHLMDVGDASELDMEFGIATETEYNVKAELLPSGKDATDNCGGDYPLSGCSSADGLPERERSDDQGHLDEMPCRKSEERPQKRKSVKKSKRIKRVSKVKKPVELKSQPCILLFDSLGANARSRVMANLRNYLTEEWKVRMPSEHVFDSFNMKGGYPKVPQQNNYCDCGVFVLHYVETFLKKPFINFRIPMHMENWFPQEEINSKRDNIKELIEKLAALPAS